MRILQYNTTTQVAAVSPYQLPTCLPGVASPPPSLLAATRARHRVASARCGLGGRGAKSPLLGNLGGWWFFKP